MLRCKWHVYPKRHVQCGISVTDKFILTRTSSSGVTSFTDTAVWALKVRQESVFLILADVFTRTVWQLIGIYGTYFCNATSDESILNTDAGSDKFKAGWDRVATQAIPRSFYQGQLLNVPRYPHLQAGCDPVREKNYGSYARRRSHLFASSRWKFHVSPDWEFRYFKPQNVRVAESKCRSV